MRRFLVSASWRVAGALCAAACLGACYTYTAPLEVRPEIGRTFAFEPTDEGRAALAAGIGAGTERIEGALLDLTDTTYGVQVARVVDVRGQVTRWSGEVVSLRRDYIGTVRERRNSPARTALAVGGVAAGVAALVSVATLDVFGNESGGQTGEPPPPAEDSRRFPFTLHRSR